MSGVETRSRLERLLSLRTRTEQEIVALATTLATEAGSLMPGTREGETIEQRLARLRALKAQVADEITYLDKGRRAIEQRVKRLRAQRDKSAAEIARLERLERLVQRNGGEGFTVVTRPPRRTGGLAASDATVEARLASLGVSARDVKVWAVSVGLVPAVVRGRVASQLVEKYAEAHPVADWTPPTEGVE